MGKEDSTPLYFKHLYGANPEEWGVVGFPKNQPSSTAIQIYESGGRGIVLLAVTKHPDTDNRTLAFGQEGKIFSGCTFLSLEGITRQLANPEMVNHFPWVSERWPQAVVIDKLWRLEESKSYDDFVNGELMELARIRRGQLIPLADHPRIQSEVRQWWSSTPRREVDVYRSKRTRELLALMPRR